jgi:hypothetical protein
MSVTNHPVYKCDCCGKEETNEQISVTVKFSARFPTSGFYYIGEEVKEHLCEACADGFGIRPPALKHNFFKIMWGARNIFRRKK